MINLAYLLFVCAKNNTKLLYGINKNKEDEKLDIFDDEQEDMYFDAASQLRIALEFEPNNADANYLMAVFCEQGLSIESSDQLAFKYYEKAKQNGHLVASDKVQEMLEIEE